MVGIKVTNQGIGVNHEPSKRPKVYTTRIDDFVASAKKFSQSDLIYDGGGPPLVFVIKKNYKVLEALNKWLKVQLDSEKSKFKKSC